MLKLPLLLMILSGSLFASSKEEAAHLLSRFSSKLDTVERLESFSRAFIGLPYGDGGPLGEGSTGRYDQDPLYRFDTFDCTTYVETVVSLAMTRHVSEFERQMDLIRYENGVVDYLTRNHFPSLQWIPYNVQSGLLSEINDEILPLPEQSLAEAIIDLPGWLKKIRLEEIRVPEASLEERIFLRDELRSRAQDFSPQKAQLPYIPIRTLLDRPELIKKIPHGSLVNFVRPNWDLTQTAGTHMNVSHQGFLFRRGSVLYLRHASSSGEKRVTEVSFLDYLRPLGDHPTMKGVHFMKVN